MNMTIPQPARIYFFVIGQIVLTFGAFSWLLLPSIPAALSLGLVLVGAGLLGFGAGKVDKQVATLFPLRVRVSLFVLSLAILALAFLV